MLSYPLISYDHRSFLGRDLQWFFMYCCQHGEDVPRKECSPHWFGKVVELQPGLTCVPPRIRGIPQDSVCSMPFNITRNPHCPDESTYRSVIDRFFYHKGMAISGRINVNSFFFWQGNCCFNYAWFLFFVVRTIPHPNLYNCLGLQIRFCSHLCLSGFCNEVVNMDSL